MGMRNPFPPYHLYQTIRHKHKKGHQPKIQQQKIRKLIQLSKKLNKFQKSNANNYLYNLKPVDYLKIPPVEKIPPPPPSKSGFRNYVFPLSLFLSLGLVGYFGFHNKNDAYVYWDAMQ